MCDLYLSQITWYSRCHTLFSKRNLSLIRPFSLVPLGHWSWHKVLKILPNTIFSKRNATLENLTFFGEECSKRRIGGAFSKYDNDKDLERDVLQHIHVSQFSSEPLGSSLYIRSSCLQCIQYNIIGNMLGCLMYMWFWNTDQRWVLSLNMTSDRDTRSRNWLQSQALTKKVDRGWSQFWFWFTVTENSS